MKEIKLTKDQIALVDDEDYEDLSKYRWQARPWKYGWYASRRCKDGCVYMHRQIMNATQKELIDHEDTNGLNNQKWNLRKATRKDNGGNRSTKVQTITNLKGVGIKVFAKGNIMYRAYIHINKKYKHLGYFDRAKDAAKAYDQAAMTYFGNFAKQNMVS